MSWRWVVLMGVAVFSTAGALLATTEVPVVLGLDNGRLVFPLALESHRAWMSGSLPEWTDLLWGGTTLLGHGLSGALYPPFGLAFLATGAPHLRALDVVFAMHLGWLASGSLWLLATMGLPLRIAAVGAVMAVLSNFALWIGLAFLPGFVALAWWPWLFGACERLAVDRTPAHSVVLLAWVAIAAQVLVGYPERAFYASVIAVGWLCLRRSEVSFSTRAWRAIVMGVGGVALSAPSLGPMVAQVAESARAVTTVDAGTLALPVAWLPELVQIWSLPAFQMSAFVGLVSVALALVGTSRRPYLAAVTLFALVMALGSQTPLYGWVHALPGFERFRSPMKFMAQVEVGTAWLAAIGAARLLATRSRTAAVLAVIALAAAVGERAVRVVVALPGHRAIGAAEHAVGVTLDGTRALGLRASPEGVRPRLVFDGIRVRPGRARRVDGVLAVDGVPTFRGGQLPLINRRQSALGFRRLPEPVTLARLGVEQVIVSEAQCADTASTRGFALQARTPWLCLFDVAGAAPRYTLEGRVESVADEAALVKSVFAKRGAPVAVLGALPQLPARGLQQQQLQLEGRIRVAEERPGRVRLVTEAKTPALLVIRRSWDPGWTARVDGSEAELLPALGSFMALGVSSGRHEVELIYRAPWLRLGIAVAIAWLLGWGLRGHFASSEYRRSQRAGSNPLTV